jgi:TusA-related sulfurtransferase
VLVVSADLLTTVSARRELDLIIARRLAKSPKGAVLPVLTDNSQLPSVLRDLKSLDLHEMNGEKAAESLMEAVISRLTERAVLFGLKR